MVDYGTTEIKILKAAKQLFIENGYHDTSVAAIAKEAGLGKGTLYWHFDSKDELFKAMITREGQVVLAEISELLASEQPVEETLKEFIGLRIKRMSEHKKASQMFFDNENLMNDEFRQTMFDIYFAIIDELKKIIKAGVENGIFEVESSEQTAAALMGVIHGICSTNFFDSEKELELENNVDFIYNLFMKGIKKKEVEA